MNTCARMVAVAAVALAPLAASAQTPAGADFLVNTYTTGRQWFPRVAASAAGGFVVVWSSYGQDGSGDGVFGQAFDAAGVRRGAEFRVNTYTTGDQSSGFASRAALGVARRGRAVAAWSSQGQDGDLAGVFAQPYQRGGPPLGPELQVNSTTASYQFEPAAAPTRDGGFVVVWTSYAQDGAREGVFGQRFDSGGRPAGAEFLVNTTTASYQKDPQVAAFAAGGFVVVWTGDGPHGPLAPGRLHTATNVFGQRFDAAGARLGGEFLASTGTDGYRYFPSLAAAGDGSFVVVWDSDAQDGNSLGVFGRRFGSDGQPRGGEFQVNSFTTGAQAISSVASDDHGNFTLAWVSDGQGSGIFAQRFAADGTRRGAEFQVNATGGGPQGAPSVSSDAVGNVVAAWISPTADGSNLAVAARRFGGLLPAGLTVTDGGNGVLEAPESFTLVTSWRNVNGAPQAFQGRASSLLAPAGLTFTLSPDANYGTVPNGTVGSCASPCFAGSLAGTRPAGHVDVSLLESLLPDAQGQKQRWRVHVGESFADVPRSNPFYRFIETLLHHGVTGGCSASEYCPAASTTRDQMAVFVLVAAEGSGYTPPACTAPVFGDVAAASPFCRWVEELARRGVVGGCGGGNYCPAAAVTREQMAVFVLRTLDPALIPPACTTPVFADVPASSPFCRWIEELARRGVVTGCGGGNYCPTAPVTREQMGVFISATFGLLLYGP